MAIARLWSGSNAVFVGLVVAVALIVASSAQHFDVFSGGLNGVMIDGVRVDPNSPAILSEVLDIANKQITPHQHHTPQQQPQQPQQPSAHGAAAAGQAPNPLQFGPRSYSAFDVILQRLPATLLSSLSSYQFTERLLKARSAAAVVLDAASRAWFWKRQAVDELLRAVAPHLSTLLRADAEHVRALIAVGDFSNALARLQSALDSQLNALAFMRLGAAVLNVRDVYHKVAAAHKVIGRARGHVVTMDAALAEYAFVFDGVFGDAADRCAYVKAKIAYLEREIQFLQHILAQHPALIAELKRQHAMLSADFVDGAWNTALAAASTASMFVGGAGTVLKVTTAAVTVLYAGATIATGYEVHLTNGQLLELDARTEAAQLALTTLKQTLAEAKSC